jgi:protein-disulfide isomerase
MILIVAASLALAVGLLPRHVGEKTATAQAADPSAAAAAAEQQSPPGIDPRYRVALYDDKDAPAAGPTNPSVTLVEFFDYRCPYCKQMNAGIDQLLSEFPNLRVVFKEFPILAPDSLTAAKAALAANAQGKYLPYHRLLLAHRGDFDQATLDDLAQQAGLDIQRLHRDMEDPAYIAQMRATRKLAQEIGVEGTPAFILGDQLIGGAVPVEDLRQAIMKIQQGG